ncbi:FAD:protein FMN transferase [Nocardioides sp. DS6]|uniref:FAD:protein FMN transferase n=1 Tax=Nocardioides eburneus TaxID=3231482 RepID=A0ABV3T3E9_9ACTN
MSGHDAATTSWRDWSCAVTVTVSDRRRLEAAVGVVRDLMADVEHAVSRFRPDSDLERVNDRSGRLVVVRPLTFHLVETAVRAARLTAGAVDPTVGTALIDLGYDADITVAATRAASGPIAVGPTAIGPAPAASAPTGRWRSVRLDRTLLRVGVPAGVRLDLGATAKAWAADEAARRIHRRLGGAVLVGLGGDMATAGPATRPWRIDVAETEGADAVRVGLSDGGLATSSIVGRRWVGPDDAVRHHIVDPRTGLPAAGAWRTATVWAPSALAANVASTWALVDGAAATAHIAARGLAARLVDRAGRARLLGGWPAEEVKAS